MSRRNVTTQAELDAVVAAGDTPVCRGDGRFVARDIASVEAWDSAHVEAWGTTHVVARVIASVEAWDSAHVVARDIASVEAWGTTHVVAGESTRIVAHRGVQVHAHPGSTIAASAGAVVTCVQGREGVTVTGEGTVLDPPPILTAEEWCAAHDVPITDGVVTLFKVVGSEFTSSGGISWRPGTTPVAPDWDDGEQECGGGLHFFPRPTAGLQFLLIRPEARRFVACPVALADIAVHPDPVFPHQVKARACCGPVHEVDIHGRPVEE